MKHAISLKSITRLLQLKMKNEPAIGEVKIVEMILIDPWMLPKAQFIVDACSVYDAYMPSPPRLYDEE
ncbi:hypothetical protein Y032_0120g919 [Ancylostoma ceylanicum]|uniref:Uncharacterized protein n=1 Tax=Ancylostoma ceylanicum TaxID=53326 RepID=A0A016TAN8_9BILA|nr:hypothetical protein Y032_0120g919 [Ancylostoma ceylanicum]